MRQLIEDLISMMEYHVEQTRPIHSTTVALQAAREALKSLPPQRTEPIQSLQCFHCQVTIETLNAKVMHLMAQRIEQEPVAWIHNFIEGGISIGKRPADLSLHPDRWTALYKDPKPCPTCEALARTVMLDQTSHDTTPQQRT